MFEGIATVQETVDGRNADAIVSLGRSDLRMELMAK